MDSRERDQRAEDGFNERGERLYDADDKDERKRIREERRRRRKLKDKTEFNQFEKRRVEKPNQYGLDDEEYEDIDELPNEDEEELPDNEE